MKRLLAVFAANNVFANIILFLVFVAGGIALSSMVRESFPQFSVDLISINVTYPGADPEEIEEGVCLKLEDALKAIEGVKQYTTTASENVGSALVEVEDGYDVQEVLDEIKSNVDAISTFPIDAEKPIVTEIVMRESVILLALSGDLSEKQLKVWAEDVRDEIKLLPGISQVEVFGARDYEVSVEVSEESLRRYNITFGQVAEAIRSSSINLHGGTIRTQGEEIRVRTVGRKYTGAELAGIVVLARPAGEQVTLGQLADIRDGFTQDPVSALVDGKPSVFVMVFKTSEEDSLHISRTVSEYLEVKKKQLPPGADLTDFYDNTVMLKSRINLLSRNGLLGMGLVFFLLWLFLDLRLSFWAGLGIPVSLAGGLFVLWSMGETINMISLFGFIMVLGIVVDDAIVVGEAIYVHRMCGEPPLKAAVEGVCEVGMPVFAAVITTIVAFIPLAFVGGIMGKFISILPAVVVSCLLISLLECLFLLPAHLNHLPDLNRRVSRRNPVARMMVRFQTFMQEGLKRFVEKRYKPFLDLVLDWRYVSFAIAIAILMLSVGLVKGGLVKFHVFPKLDGFVVTSTAEFPDGTPPHVTEKALKDIESAFVRVADRTPTLNGEPLVKKRLVLVGQTLGEQKRKTGPNFGSVQFILVDSENRDIHSNDLLVEWEKEVGSIPGAKSLVFEGLAAGPGGAEIEIWLYGKNLDSILAATGEMERKLHSFEGVVQIRNDFSLGKNELRLNLKPEARSLGLTVEDLAKQVNAGFFGQEAFRMQRGKDDIRVKVRLTDDERHHITSFEQMRIRTKDNREIPLLSVADVAYGPGFSMIQRTNGQRRVAVLADVDPKRANSNEVIDELESSFIPQLKQRYPGLHVKQQGAKKNARESLDSLKVSFPLAIFGIFVIIATIFRSYAQPFVILFTIPFGIIGAIVGHLVLGYDLSIMSMFGMVALTGVVVNDAIVFIERVNENLAEGMAFKEAVKQGGSRRFRAILLTTFSTVGGLAPLILETDMQAKFLIPMALSLAAGVIFATALTLVLIPSLLVILNDLRRVIAWMFTGNWPERERVEPASARGVAREMLQQFD